MKKTIIKIISLLLAMIFVMPFLNSCVNESKSDAQEKNIEKVIEDKKLYKLGKKYDNADSLEQKKIEDEIVSYFAELKKDYKITDFIFDPENEVVEFFVGEISGLYSFKKPQNESQNQSSNINVTNFDSNDAFVPSQKLNALIVSATETNKLAYENLQNKLESSNVNVNVIENATVKDFKTALSNFDIAFLNTYGICIEEKPYMCISEKMTKENYNAYYNDISTSVVKVLKYVGEKDSYYAISPEFFTENYKNNKLTNLVVHSSAPYSFINSAFADAFQEIEALSFAGYSNEVQNDYLENTVSTYTMGLISNMTTIEAHRLAIKEHGESDADNTPAYFLISGGKAKISPYNTVKKGQLTVATSADFEPLAYRNGLDFTGFDMDFIMNIAKYLNLEVEFVKCDFNDLVSTVSQNQADVAIAGISSKNTQFDNSVIFSKVYITSKDIFYNDYFFEEYQIVIGSKTELSEDVDRLIELFNENGTTNILIQKYKSNPQVANKDGLPAKVDLNGKNIVIEGISKLEFDAGQREQRDRFCNSEKNTNICYIQFYVYLDENKNKEIDENEKLIYRSDLLKPGYSITKYNLVYPLSENEYSAIVLCETYSYDKECRKLKQVIMSTKLIVK